MTKNFEALSKKWSLASLKGAYYAGTHSQSRHRPTGIEPKVFHFASMPALQDQWFSSIFFPQYVVAKLWIETDHWVTPLSFNPPKHTSDLLTGDSREEIFVSNKCLAFAFAFLSAPFLCQFDRVAEQGKLFEFMKPRGETAQFSSQIKTKIQSIIARPCIKWNVFFRLFRSRNRENVRRTALKRGKWTNGRLIWGFNPSEMNGWASKVFGKNVGQCSGLEANTPLTRPLPLSISMTEKS